ncbi:hypothetical protein WAK64_07850 [Bacillus spongiae]|uniref:Uncharacterized protein n=1 Tax=Bacillus spongiae TaxID=2683610 RepID=A0ABU8HD45_9BACI
MEGILFFFILFLAALLIFIKHIKWWIKLFVALYYGILIYFFSKGYKKIQDDYELYRSKNEYNPNDPADVKALENYWDPLADYAGNFEVFFHLPVLILLTFSYYKWIKNGKNKTQRILIVLSLIPVSLIYLWIAILIGMLGYQP